MKRFRYTYTKYTKPYVYRTRRGGAFFVFCFFCIQYASPPPRRSSARADVCEANSTRYTLTPVARACELCVSDVSSALPLPFWPGPPSLDLRTPMAMRTINGTIPLVSLAPFPAELPRHDNQEKGFAWSHAGPASDYLRHMCRLRGRFKTEPAYCAYRACAASGTDTVE